MSRPGSPPLTPEAGRALFAAEFGSAASAFWVDRPDGTALLGSADRVATYTVGDGVRIDGALVAADLWAWLEELTGPEGEDRDETWVGYLGYGVKAITRGGAAHPVPGTQPDAVWMRADRMIEIPAPQDQPGPHAHPGDPRPVAPWSGPSTTSREEAGYLADIATIKEHLARGETYEVCLTRRLDVITPDLAPRAIIPGPAPDPAPDAAPDAATDAAPDRLQQERRSDPFELFWQMRTSSPTSRSVFLRHAGLAVCSATPEEFLTLTPEGLVSSSPIKGTAARHLDDPEADRRAAAELVTDPKTRAENLMIVDLVRNDLHQVCVPGTVAVPRFLEVESYASVHQLVSTVTGRLAPGRTRVDAIRAAFPPGSMTGAPKERTMQIIDELEPVPRGIYSGAIGVLGGDGSADLRVVIRTAVVDELGVSIGTGGAIVWASDPAAEWAETELKAASVLGAIAALERS